MKTNFIANYFVILLIVGCVSVESEPSGGESPRLIQGDFDNEESLSSSNDSTTVGNMLVVDESTSYASLKEEKGSAHAADIEQSKAQTGAVLLAGAALAGGAIVKGADVVGNKMNQIQAENYQFESKNKAHGAYKCPKCDGFGKIDPTHSSQSFVDKMLQGYVRCPRCDGTGWLLNGNPHNPHR